jgi:hypothetical protein
MDSNKPTSVAYSQGITALIFVSALLGLFIMPMEGFGPSDPDVPPFDTTRAQ